MRPYILFIDTETSGLPKKWNAPCTDVNNWPYIVQISWVIYTDKGNLVKRENHYINNNDFKSSPTSVLIHGISDEYRQQWGESRLKVMTFLAEDLYQYEPLLVAHFAELDLNMMGADFYRAGIKNPAENLPSFCTMVASAPYVRNPNAKYLKLDELYFALFKYPLQNQHNALIDAFATAKCFFQLLKQGEINDIRIDQQQKYLRTIKAESKNPGYGIPILIVFLLTVLIAFLL